MRIADDRHLDRAVHRHVGDAEEVAEGRRVQRHGLRERLEQPVGPAPHVDVVQQLAQLQQQLRRERAARRHGVVGHLARPRDERLMVAGRVEERVRRVIPEPGGHRRGDVAGGVEPVAIEGELPERDEAEPDRGVVVEVARQVRPARGVRAHHPTVADHLALDELAVADGQRPKIIATERACRLAHRPQREPVPGGEDLLVARGPGARGARIVERTTRARDGGQQLPLLDPGPARGHARVHADIQDVAALEIPVARDIPECLDHARVLAEQAVHLFLVPQVELALVPLAVGVERGVEPAALRRHLAAQPFDRLLGHAPRLRVAGRLPEMDREPREQGVVVEHLLEVGHQPHRVHGIAREPPADLVVDAAPGHARKGMADHLEHGGGAGACPHAQQEVERHGLRKLGRAAKAAVAAVVLAGERSIGAFEETGREHA